MSYNTVVQLDGNFATPVTHIIAVRDKDGRPAPDPDSLDLTVQVGETVVWRSDNARPFYVRFSPFMKHLSVMEGGRQTIVLPVVTEFSGEDLDYDLGYVDEVTSSSPVASNSLPVASRTTGLSITCSTCTPGDSKPSR